MRHSHGALLCFGMLVLAGCDGQLDLAALGVVLNEAQADNFSTATDNVAEFDDWVEIYNSGLSEIDLGGFYLSDDPINFTKYTFPPNTILAPESFLVVWCDGQPDQGWSHADFQLSALGESVYLFGGLDTDAEQIDQLSWDMMNVDTSVGRAVDGSSEIIPFDVPTPGAPNS